ncbi:hypothetical protein J2S13_000737 [Oikeobacillus pervagus]|uniref:Uncharacterized protein n=1 Tax=Oikeobacillus pervagus TaxID=1325931 RepID=A0AAJ1T301_9BACI|nr:hypothetical protein [Oikeobacillus pervagus]MDQ0214341.1 hypothetical protein [Oikeobacillus pervagus]
MSNRRKTKVLAYFQLFKSMGIINEHEFSMMKDKICQDAKLKDRFS